MYLNELLSSISLIHTLYDYVIYVHFQIESIKAILKRVKLHSLDIVSIKSYVENENNFTFPSINVTSINYIQSFNRYKFLFIMHKTSSQSYITALQSWLQLLNSFSCIINSQL